MEKSNKYVIVLRLFLIIFFIFSLKVAREALFKNVLIENEEDYHIESEILRKKLIKNTACMTEIIKLCKSTGYMPNDFLKTLRNEYYENFKRLNELKSKHLDLEINLTINNKVKNYMNSQLNFDFQNSKLSIEDYCSEYNFENFYNQLDENINQIEF